MHRGKIGRVAPIWGWLENLVLAVLVVMVSISSCPLILPRGSVQLILGRFVLREVNGLVVAVLVQIFGLEVEHRGIPTRAAQRIVQVVCRHE